MRGKNIHVPSFIIRSRKPLNLDNSLFDQLFEAIIELSQTEAHFTGHLALGEVGVIAKELEEAVAYFVVVGVVHEVNNETYRRINCKGKMIRA